MDGLERLNRYEPRDVVLVGVAAVVLFSAVTGRLSSFTTVLGITVLPTLVMRVAGAVDLSVPVQRAVFGVLIALGGAVAVSTVAPESRWLVPAGAVGGCWIVLDAIDASQVSERDEHTAAGDRSARTTLTRAAHSRSVVDALEHASRPLTVEELRERTGLALTDLKATLERVQTNGTVERIGTGYVVGERDRQTVAIVREIGSSVAGRICRPFRLFRPSR